MQKTLGPGPGAYLLPPTIGYEKHDVSRLRNPQYSMAGKHKLIGKPIGPGPNYNVDKFTCHGKVSPPAYSLKSRLVPLKQFKTPGPGTYSPEKGPRMRDPRPPAYSMSSRLKPLTRFNTPGPNQYGVPTTLGPKVPDIPAAAAYSMSAKHGLKPKERSPGPAQYNGISTDIFKNQNPQYTMSIKPKPLSIKCPSPGPAAYMLKIPGAVPGGLSMGRRTGKVPYITADDHLPCKD